MHDFFEMIKNIAVNAVNAGKPVHIMFGTVKETSPFSVEVASDLRFTLPSKFLIFLSSKPKEYFDQKDKVILLRVQGGQKYVVLDKVVAE